MVGAVIVAGDEPNTTFAQVFDHLPVHESEPESVGTIRLIDLLPTGAGHLTYVGSLTTPPCSEGVRWLLVDEFVLLTQAQIDAFGAIFPLNARPVQPLNTRDLLRDANT